MPTGTTAKKFWIKAGLIAGFWTLIGLSFASQFYISSYKAGSFVTWRQAVSYALGDWYVFAVLSIPVIHWARRFRFEGREWARSLIVHLAGSVLFSLSYMVLRAGVGMGQSLLGGAPVSFPEAFRPLLVKTWHFNLLIYWVILSVGHAFDYYRRYQEREFRAAELEKHLAQAKLHDQRDRTNEALQTYRRVVELDPEHELARMRMTTILLLSRQGEEALPHLEFLRRRLPDHPELLVQMAQALASVHFSLPYLSDNSAGSCPVTAHQLARYVRAHSDGAEIDSTRIAFVRTAQVEQCRYWMWRYELEGAPSYALVMEDGEGAWLSSYAGEGRLSPEEVLLADYHNALLDA